MKQEFKLYKDRNGMYRIDGEISDQTKKDLDFLNDSVYGFNNTWKWAHRIQIACVAISACCFVFLFLKWFIQ